MKTHSPHAGLTVALAMVAAMLFAAGPVQAAAEAAYTHVPGASARFADPASMPSSERRSAAMAGLGTYTCGPWKGYGGIGWRYCANITRYNGHFSTDYLNSQFNQFRRQTIGFSCSTSKSRTWTFGGSATVEAEAGVIFAKAKTSITASLSKSTTTTDTTSASYRIRPRSWAHCERGTYVYTWSGFTRKQTCDSSGCVYSGLKSYTKHAPTREAWRIGPGRG